jgi:mono/diheme cytochrome c family protein
MLKLAAASVAILAVSMSSALAQTPVERGDYLVNTIMTCGNCHHPQSPNGPVMAKAFSGGVEFDFPPFKVTAANITPDRTTGIGAWSDADIKRAIQHGVRPNGVPLAAVMPSAFYKILTPRDLDAIVAYLRSIKPIENKVPDPVYKIAIPHTTFPGAEKPMPARDFGNKVKRGFYLAAIGHCMECHTPLKEGAQDFKGALGKGGQEFPGPWGVSKSPNITAHKKAGIGAWSDAEIKRAITQGVSRDGRKMLPPMGYPYYAGMKAADLDALVAYLRTVPPKE